MNDHVNSPSRRPIIIADSLLSTGRATAPIRRDDPEALLRDYLRLIRRVRNQQRDRSVALRRVDIATLAGHLGWSEESVLARLADLMGVTRRERAAMLAVLATGAALITIVSPFAAAAASDPPETAAIAPEPSVVVLTDGFGSPSRSAANLATVRVALTDADVERPSTRVPRHAPVLEAQRQRDDVPAGQVRRDFEPEAHEQPVEVPTGTDADGHTVAVGSPPVPPVAPSDVPPPEPTTGVVDGATVAVGLPPIPPAVDADGNAVAVGLPPVPPPPPADA